MMVGRQASPFGMVYFQGRTVKLPESNWWFDVSRTGGDSPNSPEQLLYRLNVKKSPETQFEPEQ